MSDPTRVAIACQGGGSHTAFTAGVLTELLSKWDDDRWELVGISGTSGGAFNALVTWYGLVTADEARAVELLDGLWTDLAASEPFDRWVNQWITGYSKVEAAGVPVPQVSPYQSPGSDYGQDRLRSVLERHVDFDAIPDLCRREHPELVVGTVDVQGGEFETFTNEDVSTDAVLASAAVPNLFRGVEIHGHLHWDGLFSQNPPINDLFHVDRDRKPQELWIVQVNPQEVAGNPTTLDEIADRRNELSGNISLNQEVRFIQRVNDWIDRGHLPDDTFCKCQVRRIEMPDTYHCSTKLDRSPAFVEELRDLGSSKAASFLESLP